MLSAPVAAAAVAKKVDENENLTPNESLAIFSTLMNRKAEELGCERSNFDNPHGYHDDDHYTTVLDIHKLATVAFGVEKIKTICGYSRYVMPPTNLHGERTLSTTNFLINKTTNYYYKYKDTPLPNSDEFRKRFERDEILEEIVMYYLNNRK